MSRPLACLLLLAMVAGLAIGMGASVLSTIGPAITGFAHLGMPA